MTPARVLYGLAALVLLLATTACLVHGHLALGVLTESGDDTARIIATLLTLALPALGLLLALVAVLRRRPLPHLSSPGRALVFLGALVLVTRFLAMAVTLPRPVSDFAVYHELAWAISDGQGLSYAHDTGLSEDMPYYLNRFVDGGVHPTAFRAPGAPLLYGLLYVVTGPDVGAAFLLNVLMALATTVLLYLLLAPHEPGAAFWAAFLWALYPAPLLANLLVGSETPFLLLILLAAVIADRAARLPRDGRQAPPLVLLGLTLGCAALTRPTPGLLPAALIAAALVAKPSPAAPAAPSTRSRIFRALALALVGFALPHLLFGLRNLATLGSFTLSPTSSGRNLHDFAPTLGVSPADLLADRRLMRSTTDEFALAALGRQVARRRILGFLTLPPSVALTGAAVNWFALWGTDRPLLEWVATGSPEVATLLEGHDLPLASLTPGQPAPFPEQAKLAAGLLTDGPYLGLLLLAFLGALRLALRPPAPATSFPLPGPVVLILPLLTLAAVFTIFTGNPRFHLAVMPACAVLAGSLLGDRRPPRAAA